MVIKRLGVGIQYRIQNVKKFQLWGSDSPNVTDDFSGWVKLGEFEIKKPSGLPWGEDSADDAVPGCAAGDSFAIDPAAPPCTLHPLCSRRQLGWEARYRCCW